MQVKLISITPEAEKIITYCARVSSDNQDNPEIEKLLKYCLKNKHWSIFEMANMCVEIETSRAISAQILRHKSFSFQEFSQRYSENIGFENYEARRQDLKNRQNSINDLDRETKAWFYQSQLYIQEQAENQYDQALDKGIAKELARFLLPMSARTKLYTNGNIRSWITYLETRLNKSTQLEHREIAEEIKKIFVEQLPIISKALNFC